MPKSFSLYLDTVRFIAACLVVFSHLAKENVFPAGITPYIPDFGREAVILFFVLSGFVIAYTKEHKHSEISDYCIARLTRIYSVALPILLLTVVLDLIGLSYNPAEYGALYQYEKLYVYIPMHLLFLGEIWTLSEQPFTVVPYWSLGYEVWYYVFFIFFGFYSGIKRWLLCLLAVVFFGYKLLLLLPIWLAGVFLYKHRKLIKLTPVVAQILFCLSLISMFMFERYDMDAYLLSLGADIWPFQGLPLGSATPYLADYAMCILVVINFYSAQFLSFKWLSYGRKAIVILSSYTFTLYLLHAPVMLFILRNTNIPEASYIGTIGLILAIFLSTFLVGELTEKRKHLFKPFVTSVVLKASWLINKTPLVSQLLNVKTK